MPVFLVPLIAFVVRVLMLRAGAILISAILGVGVSFFTFKFAVAPFREMIANQMAGVGAQFLNWLGYLGVDQFVTIVLSAIAAKFAIAGLRAGLSKKV